jgi:plastocyanin
MPSKANMLSGFAAGVALAALVIASAAFVSSSPRQPGGRDSMTGGGGSGSSVMMPVGRAGGMMSRGYTGSMTGGARTEAGPGEDGFAPGTASSPRVVRIVAGPGYAFSPSTVRVARGETILFSVSTMGPEAHEFMVGPADAVASDAAGTSEAADIAMMTTKSVLYTFENSGPYAYACHAPGHYEAGMRGTITVVG